MVLISIQVQHITGTTIACISYRQSLPNAVPLLRCYLHPEDQFVSQGEILIVNLKARLYIGIFKMVTLYLSIGRCVYTLAVPYSWLVISDFLPPVPLRHHFSKVVLVCDRLLFCFLYTIQASKYPYILSIVKEKDGWLLGAKFAKSSS